MGSSNSDYRWFVESIERCGGTDDPDEITGIIMEAIGKAGIEGKDELVAVAVLIFQFFGSKVLLHNFRRVIVNIPESGSTAGSESWATTSDLAATFLTAMTEELGNLAGLASQKDVTWAVAMHVADSLLGEIAQNCVDLVAQIPQGVSH